MLARQPSRFGVVLIGALCAMSVASCQPGGRTQSGLSKWIDKPTTGMKAGNVIAIPDLGVKFEIPDTLYVFKQCGEASHTPDGAQGWIPVVTCRSVTSGEFGSSDGGDDDPFASEEIAESSGAEDIALTVYVTEKTRPLDERAVSWFENQYRQNGLIVDEISYQSDYQKKSGIYAKLHVSDGSENATPSREIVQFLFPREDVVFIARMEYPFGDTRAVQQDWSYILWNFDFTELGAAPPPAAASGADEEEEEEEEEPASEDDLGL